jgi:hypothetical protein
MLNLDIHAGTILYWRSIWENITKFQPVYCGEDAIFVNNAFGAGAKIQDMPDHDTFVYICHDKNTWKIPCGEYGHPNGGEEFCLLNLWKSMSSIFIDLYTNENLLYADILRLRRTTLANIISCNYKIILGIVNLAHKCHYLNLLVAAAEL